MHAYMDTSLTNFEPSIFLVVTTTAKFNPIEKFSLLEFSAINEKYNWQGSKTSGKQNN